MGRRSSLLAGLVAVAASGGPSLAAQSVLPERPFLVVQIDGPDAFAQKFAATNVGAMLAAKEAGKFWQGLEAALRANGAADPEWVRDTFGALREGLRTYGGRITLGLAFDKTGDRDAMPRMHGVLVLAQDGKTDLGALAKQLETTLRKSGPVRNVKVGDAEHPAVVTAGGDGFTLPSVVEGQLVTRLGVGIEAGLGEWLAARTGPVPDDAEAKASPFALRLDLQQLVERMRGSWWSETAKEEKAFAALGLLSLRDLRLLVRPAGPRVVVETSVGFGPEDHGVFDVFLPALTTPPALLPLVPADAGEWTASKFRAGRLVEIVVAMLELFDEKRPLADDDNPFRLVEPDYLQLGNLIATEQGGGMGFDPFGDFTIAVRVKDPAAYAAAVPRFMKRTGQLPAAIDAAETFPEGTQALRVSIFGFLALVHAQRGDLIVIAHGEDAEARAAKLLAQKPGEPPAEVAKRKAQQPPGVHGCGRIDVRSLLTAPPGGFLLAGVELDAGSTPWLEALEPIRPLLEQHELHWAWTFAGYHENRYRHRVVW